MKRILVVLISLLFPVSVYAQDWVWQNPTPTENHLTSVFFTDPNNGGAVGDAGTILRTTNGGTTWTIQSDGTTNMLSSVFSTDPVTGWAVGGNGTIVHTTNGGTTWTMQTSGTTTSLQSVFFSNPNTGWAVGQLGTIVHSTNGGTTWIMQTSGTTNGLQSVFFVDSDTGWLVGRSGTILLTNNGGTTWTAQSSGTQTPLYSVFFTDPNVGWAAGENGTIVHTTNGGTTWTAQSSGTTIWLESVFFTDPGTGWVVGQDGTIRHTTTGGTTWTAQASGTTTWLNSVFFTDPNTGWAVGRYSTILHTTNGGTTWTAQSVGKHLPSQVTLLAPGNSSVITADSAFFSWLPAEPDVDFYWVEYSTDSLFSPSTVDSTLVTTTTTVRNLEHDETYWWRVRAHNGTGWGPFSEVWSFTVLLTTVNEEKQVPTVYSLSQNYPNPFNPSTTIRYGLPERSHVRLEVYNLAGQRVATLINGEQQAGWHDVVLDDRTLATGLYFYRLRAGDFMETKKLLFLR